MRNFFDLLLYLICGIPVVFAVDEDDPRKKARIRRRMERRERRKNGKKADV